jgi:peptidyl-prolyl cis-trans isomerase B (cyclophilin B)
MNDVSRVVLRSNGDRLLGFVVAHGECDRFAAPLMSTPQPAAEHAVIKTSYGEMTLAFWPDVAPKTVENFKKLAREKFYDGTAFHRIIKGFMVQGGCPNTRKGESGMPGTGGPGYKIKAEFNPKSHVRGVISMARSAHPDSAGSQFFLCHGDAKFLDRQYTAFGELVKGDDVLERIASVPTQSGGGGEESNPIERVEIESITIVPAA